MFLRLSRKAPYSIANFSQVSRAETSDRVLKEMKWRLPGLKILDRFLGFSAQTNGLNNLFNRYHFFSPGLKKEREHAHLLCFCTSVNFLGEICVLPSG